jgi:protein farnesyltransferase subunit beta
MPLVVISGKHRRRVRLPTTNRLVSKAITEGQESAANPKSRSRLIELQLQHQNQGSSVPTNRNMATTATATIASTSNQDPHRNVPALFTELPPIRDLLVTETSESQDSTAKECLPYLKGISSEQDGPFNQFGVPRLDRDYHIEYLYDALEDFPGKFVGLDSSRPWMVYWALTGLHLFGEDLSQLRER